MSKLVSVIIPSYNEKENIEPLFKQVDVALSGYDYEIVVVDDNSADGTAAVVSSLAGKYPAKVIVRRDERGLASAVIHGFKNSEGELLAVMDADIQHPPQVLATMIQTAKEGAELVVASRYVKGGSCEGWGLGRRIISKVALQLAHLFLPRSRPFTDPLSGYFLLKRSVIDGVDLKPTGYKILLEVMVMGHYKKAAEVPYKFNVRERGKSKLNLREQLDYLKHILSLMRRTGELVRFGKFCLVGASGVLVNEGLLWILKQYAMLPLFASSAIAVEVSIITNFLLNNFFTFRDRRQPGRRFLLRFVQFNLVSLVGLGINVGILLLLTNVFNVYYLLSNLVGIVIAMLWNYLVNLGWTWK